MTREEEILERIRKRREELEKQNEIVTLDKDDDTGETTTTLNYDNMPKEDQILFRIRARQNGWKNENYELAKEQAEKAYNDLLDGSTRENLSDFYQVYSNEAVRAAQNEDAVEYYKDEIIKTKIRNMLGETTPLTALQDFGSEVGTNVKGAVADTANLAAMGYIALTDNLDADVLYNIAKKDSGTLQTTLDNYGWGRENMERLEKLRIAHANPKDEAHDIIETLYKNVTEQNFKGDKEYFDTTIKYLNGLSNTDRFNKFERQHTLDERTARENLEVRESLGYDNISKFLLDTTGTISYMIPSIATSAGVGSVASGGVTVGAKALAKGASKKVATEVAKQAGLISMGMAAAGNTATQRLAQGYEWNKALSAGVADGLLEYISEFIGGETLNKALVGARTAVTPLGKIIGKGIDKLGLKNKWIRLGFQTLGDVSAEFTEEAVTEAISPLLNEAILGEKVEDWYQYGIDIFNAGMQSILPTLILGGMNRLQVSQTIKKQMEAITLAVEVNDYIDEEQRQKLLDGIVKAYDNASHFLSDEQSEEEYNQVVEDVYKALQEAQTKFVSARDLARLLNTEVEAQKIAGSPRIATGLLRGLEQTNNQTQNIDQTIDTPQSTVSQQTNTTQSTTSQQNELNIKAGDTYTVNYNGEQVTVKVRAIRPDENTGEIMALVQSSLGNEPVVMPLTQLENRIKELQQENTSQTKATPIKKGVNQNNVSKYDKLKQKGFKEITSDKGIQYLQVGRFSEVDEEVSDKTTPLTIERLNNAPVRIYMQYHQEGSEIRKTENRVYKNIKELKKDLPISWLNKNLYGYRISSLEGGATYRNSAYNKSYGWYSGADRITDTENKKGTTKTKPDENTKPKGLKTKTSAEERKYKAKNGQILQKFSKGLHTGENYTDGTYVYKKITAQRGGKETSEAQAYELLKGVPNIADGKIVEVVDTETGEVVKMLKTLKYEYVFSTDDSKETAEKIAKTDLLNRDNALKLAQAVNKIVDNMIDYNDPLQVGFAKDNNPYILDFSNSMIGRDDISYHDYLMRNYGYLTRFLEYFGAKEMANQIGGAVNLVERLGKLDEKNKSFMKASLNEYELAIFNELADNIIKYGINPTSVYAVINAREIPKREGNNEILRTRNRITKYGAMLVFSQEPLSEKFIDDWELTPIYENHFGENKLEETFERKPATRLEKQTAKKSVEQSQADTKTEDTQKFATDMELNDNSVVERMIRRVEADPSLREAHDITSITEIRNLTRDFLKGRLGVGQFRQHAYGVFSTLSNWIRVGQYSDIDTLMHEAGHFIDDEIVPTMYKNNPKMKSELNKLCELAFEKRYDKQPKIKLMEGFAEATRYFMINPKELATMAPVTTEIIAREFDNSPELKKFYPKMQKMFHDYINMTADERIDSKIVNGNPKHEVYVEGELKNFFRTKIIKPIFNKLEGATKYDAEIKKAWEKKYGKGKQLPTTLKLFDNIRRSNSSGESIVQQLKTGVFDPVDGKRVTTGLARILKPLIDEAEQTAKAQGISKGKQINKRLKELARLGLAERTKELYDRSIEEGKIRETGYRLPDTLTVIEEFKDDRTLHTTLKRIRKVGNDIIDYAVKKGVIKREAASDIKAKNLFYMPLNRILGEYGSFGKTQINGATGEAYKPLKGSDLDIQNPLESLVGNWARVLKTIDDNFIRQQMVKVGKEVGDYGDFFTEVPPLMKFQGEVSLEKFKDFLELHLSPEEFSNLDLDETYKLFVPEVADPRKMTLSYLNKGVRKYIKFADNDYGRPLYEILTNLNATQANMLLNVISRFNNGIRKGATTLNPFFALGNTFSDQFQAFLYSDGLVIPVISTIFDIARLGKARYLNWITQNTSREENAKLYRMYKESGASLAGKFSLQEESVFEKTPQALGVSKKQLYGKDQGLSKIKSAISSKKETFEKIMGWLPEYSEEMTRFGEFVRVFKKLTSEGMSEAQAKLEAGVKAREITQDFSIQGELMQNVNKVIPFSSAKVGGLYRFAQEFKNHPGRLSMRMGMLIGLALLVAQLRHGDDEAEDYYEELNNRKKFDNFVFNNPLDPAHPFTIKKPQGTPRYFLNFAEYVFDLASGYIPKGEEQKRFQDFLQLSLEDQLPGSDPTDLMPSFITPFLENALNQDFYYGSKIVPQELEKLDPRHQYNEYTSEFSKAIGDIFNWSPMQIDNIIEGTFAGLGSLTLDATDRIYDIITGNDTRVPTQSYATSRLMGDVFRSSESVNVVYDKLEEYEREEAEGRITQEQQEEYERLKVAKTSFNKISKQMKAIRQDSTMTTERKQEELSKLYELRTDTARYYLGKDLLNEENKAKVEQYKFYPASTTYKYEVGNKTVELSFESETIQKAYAEMLQKEYERELRKLKMRAKYRKATPEEQVEQEKQVLSNARQSVNEEMKKRVYRGQIK